MGFLRNPWENADHLPRLVGTWLPYPSTSPATTKFFWQKGAVKKACTPTEGHWHSGITNHNTHTLASLSFLIEMHPKARMGLQQMLPAECIVHKIVYKVSVPGKSTKEEFRLTFGFPTSEFLYVILAFNFCATWESEQVVFIKYQLTFFFTKVLKNVALGNYRTACKQKLIISWIVLLILKIMFMILKILAMIEVTL